MKNLVQIFFFVLGMVLLSTACEQEPTDCIDPAQIDPDAVCADIYAPVCGCDDVTYGNECEATAAGVTSWKKGECQSACIDQSMIDPNIACFTLWDPVCGCDNETYGNSCEAENWGGVTSWTQGECP